MSKFFSIYKKPPPPPADTTPPSAPTGLGVVLVGQVPTLSWTQSTDNVRVALYLIFRQTNGAGGFVQLIPGTTAALTFRDPTATTGNSYQYQVRAQDPSFNTSAASNTAAISITTSDVTAPNIPAQPTLVSQNNTTTPPTFIISWPSVTDIDPGTGAPVSGENNYDVRINGVIDPLPVNNSVNIGAATAFVIGTNSGGSPVTGSDNGTTLTATSVTGDTAAQHYGPVDEYFSSGSLVQGPGFDAIHITGQTPLGAFSKVGIELRQDRTNNAQYIFVLSFGVTNGLKLEFRLASGAQAQGSALTAHPGFPFWLRLRWDTNWSVVAEFSTNSTNPDPAANNGTWTVIGSQVMSFGQQCYVNSAADPNTAGATGGTVSCVYDQHVLGGASPNVYTANGIAGQVNTADVRARDFATNTSIFGTALNVTIPNPTIPSARPIPSFGGWLIGGPGSRYDNTTFQNYAQLLRTVVMQWFPGYDSFSTQTMKVIMTNIKVGILKTKCLLYLDATFTTTTNAIEPAAAANNWLLLTTYSNPPPNPAPTVQPNGSISRVGNTVVGGPTDSAGRTWDTFVPAFCLDYMCNGGAAGLTGSGNVANPLVDGVAVDDMQTRATVSGDWLRSGSGYQPGTTTDTAIRTGSVAILNNFRTIKGATFLAGGNVSWFNIASLVEYTNHVDWLFMENMVGGGVGNLENNSSFSQMLAIYQQMMTVNPKFAVWSQAALNADGSDISSWNSSNNTVTAHSPAWQGARYGFGCCMVLGDADLFPCGTDPFNSSGNGEPYSSAILRWFDWYAVNLATGNAYSQANALSGSNWLGPWIDGPQTAAFQGSCWRRRATNGEVWLVPKGAGPQTITFVTGTNPSGPTRTVKLINSAQDPKQNGASITTFAAGDRDGIAVRY